LCGLIAPVYFDMPHIKISGGTASGWSAASSRCRLVERLLCFSFYPNNSIIQVLHYLSLEISLGIESSNHTEEFHPSSVLLCRIQDELISRYLKIFFRQFAGHHEVALPSIPKKTLLFIFPLSYFFSYCFLLPDLDFHLS